MTTTRRGLARTVTVLASLAVLVGVPLVWQSATGDGPADPSDPFRHGIVVVGDSITARYDDDEGAESQAWWSFVGRHFDAEVRTYAQSGSGYQRPGHRCTGNRFADRVEALRRDPPSVFVVAGGRNDWASCRAGRLVVSTDADVQAAVEGYLRILRSALPRSTRIVVLGPPWGPADPWQQRRITSIVHTAALRHGMEYVGTRGTLDLPGRTDDGVHPTRAGSKALGERVIAALSEAPGPA